MSSAIREEEELKMEEDIKPPKKYVDSSMYKAAREGNFTGLENSIRQKHGGNREEEALLHRLLLETRKGNNLVHLTAESGHKDFIQQVLRQCPQLTAKPNSCGDTPFHVAARTGSSHIVEAIYIVFKAKLHGGMPTTNTPGTRQMKEMEDGGAAGIKSSLLRLKNKGGNTALHETLRSGDKKMGILLWKEDREMVGSVSEAGESALFVAAELDIWKVVVEFLDMQRKVGVWHRALSGPGKSTTNCQDILAEDLRIRLWTTRTKKKQEDFVQRWRIDLFGNLVCHGTINSHPYSFTYHSCVEVNGDSGRTANLEILDNLFAQFS